MTEPCRLDLVLDLSQRVGFAYLVIVILISYNLYAQRYDSVMDQLLLSIILWKLYGFLEKLIEFYEFTMEF